MRRVHERRHGTQEAAEPAHGIGRHRPDGHGVGGAHGAIRADAEQHRRDQAVAPEQHRQEAAGQHPHEGCGHQGCGHRGGGGHHQLLRPGHAHGADHPAGDHRRQQCIGLDAATQARRILDTQDPPDQHTRQQAAQRKQGQRRAAQQGAPEQQPQPGLFDEKDAAQRLPESLDHPPHRHTPGLDRGARVRFDFGAVGASGDGA
ncbi:hypothetical protein FQZ97_646610 [compost metagenome]